MANYCFCYRLKTFPPVILLSICKWRANGVPSVPVKAIPPHPPHPPSSALDWSIKWVLSINPNKRSCLTVGNLPPISSSFLRQTLTNWPLRSTAPRTLTRLSSRQYTAGIAIKASLLVRRTVQTSLYLTVVFQRIVMEASFPNLNAEMKHLERVQRLATWQLRGLRHVPYEERLRQLNLLSLERQRLRAEFKVFKSELD